MQSNLQTSKIAFTQQMDGQNMNNKLMNSELANADLPDYEDVNGHSFNAYTQTFETGAYIVITDTSGMDYPTATDFMVCVYRSEDVFGDDPNTSLLGEFSSYGYPDLLDAVEAAEAEAA